MSETFWVGLHHELNWITLDLIFKLPLGIKYDLGYGTIASVIEKSDRRV